jgi:hypothetical protein
LQQLEDEIVVLLVEYLHRPVDPAAQPTPSNP